MITERFVLFYETVSGFVEKRKPYREAHLRLVLEHHKRQNLLMGGALEGPEGQAMLVFSNKEGAISFAQNDPYVLNDLVKHWQVRSWQVVDLVVLEENLSGSHS